MIYIPGPRGYDQLYIEGEEESRNLQQVYIMTPPKNKSREVMDDGTKPLFFSSENYL